MRCRFPSFSSSGLALLALLLLAGPSGCALLAAQGAATAAVALGGATAMEYNANDMRLRNHEEMEAELDDFFNRGPIQPIKRSGGDPSYMQEHGLPAFPEPGEPTQAAARPEKATYTEIIDMPDAPDGAQLLEQAESGPKQPGSEKQGSQEKTGQDAQVNSFYKDYEGSFSNWPLEGASGPIEQYLESGSDSNQQNNDR